MTKETQAPQAEQGLDGKSEGDFKISKLLKRARERSGKTIEEISKITKINADYIRYIETAETEKLPSNIFLKGYVSSIAKVLGVSQKEVRDNFDLSTTNAPLISNRTKGMDSEILLPSIGKNNRKSFIPITLLAAFAIITLLFLSSYLLDISGEEIDSLEQPQSAEVKMPNGPTSDTEPAPAEDTEKEKIEFEIPEKEEKKVATAAAIDGKNKLTVRLKDGPVEIVYRIDKEGEFELALVTSELSVGFKKVIEVFCTDYKRLTWLQNGVEVVELEKGLDDKRFVFNSSTEE